MDPDLDAADPDEEGMFVLALAKYEMRGFCISVSREAIFSSSCCSLVVSLLSKCLSFSCVSSGESTDGAGSVSVCAPMSLCLPVSGSVCAPMSLCVPVSGSVWVLASTCVAWFWTLAMGVCSLSRCRTAVFMSANSASRDLSTSIICGVWPVWGSLFAVLMGESHVL